MANQDQDQDLDPERDGEGKSPRGWESRGSGTATRSSNSDSSESVEEDSERTSLLSRHGQGNVPEYKSSKRTSDEDEDGYRNEDEDEEGEVLGEQPYLRERSVFAIISLLMIGKPLPHFYPTYLLLSPSLELKCHPSIIKPNTN